MRAGYTYIYVCADRTPDPFRSETQNSLFRPLNRGSEPGSYFSVRGITFMFHVGDPSWGYPTCLSSCEVVSAIPQRSHDC